MRDNRLIKKDCVSSRTRLAPFSRRRRRPSRRRGPRRRPRPVSPRAPVWRWRSLWASLWRELMRALAARDRAETVAISPRDLDLEKRSDWDCSDLAARSPARRGTGQLLCPELLCHQATHTSRQAATSSPRRPQGASPPVSDPAATVPKAGMRVSGRKVLLVLVPLLLHP